MYEHSHFYVIHIYSGVLLLKAAPYGSVCVLFQEWDAFVGLIVADMIRKAVRSRLKF